MNNKDLGVIILAAGYSSRMKLFKPLLPLGNSTIIESSIDSFLDAGIGNITVVIGFQSEKLKPVLEDKGIKWIYNNKYSEGMYSSVVAGVSSLPDHIKAFFLLPADIPLVNSKTIHKIVEVYKQKKGGIIYPSFANRRGHPPLIDSSLFPEIISYNGSGGLKALLNKYEEKAYYIEVEDEGTVLDIDSYEDYLELCNKHKLILEKNSTL